MKKSLSNFKILTNRIFFLFIVFITISFIYYTHIQLFKERNQVDFALTYFMSSEVFSNNIYKYNPSNYPKEMDDFPYYVGGKVAGYHPLAYILFYPLTLIQPVMSAYIWLILNYLFIFMIGFILYKLNLLKGVFDLFVFAFIFCFSWPTYESTGAGQTNFILLLLFIVFIYLYKKNFKFLSFSPLSLFIIVKPQFGLFIIAFLALKKYRLTLYLLIWIILWNLFTMCFVKFGFIKMWINNTIFMGGRQSGLTYENMSIIAFLNSILKMEGIFAYMILPIFLLVFAFILILLKNKELNIPLLSTIVLFALIVSPLTEIYHLIFLYIFIYLILTKYLYYFSSADYILFALSYMLLFLRYSVNNPIIPKIALNILLILRPIGLLLLFYISLRILFASKYYIYGKKQN